jgi:cytoskeletal protein RodZ
MTTPDQARRSERTLAGRERAPAADPGPTLGERLLAARERKGVDLYRAERDTKIRAKYLAALEHGDFSELPGSVYTKGFLRNYALYLGLDPEAVLEQYRQEYGASRPSEPVIIVPPALEAPRGGFTFTPGLVVAAVLVVAVVAFAGYITLQLVRFAKPPTLAITQPSALVTEVADADRTVLSGSSDAGATITIRGPGMQVYRASADSSGNWQKEVPLSKGRNDFTVVATDPATAKDSVPVTLIITVPIPVIEAPTLSVTSPNDGAAVTNGAIPVQGTTNATSVTVAAKYLGSAAPGGARPSATPVPSGSPQATPSPPPVPAPKTISVAQDGSFSDSYQLSPGHWQLTVSASGAQGKTTTESRTVTVAFTGVDLIVQIQGGKAWLKVWVDGAIDPTIGSGGQVERDGTTLEFSGKQSVEVRTGNSGSTFFTRNGTSLGALGPDGIPQTWLFAPPPAAPKQTDRT